MHGSSGFTSLSSCFNRFDLPRSRYKTKAKIFMEALCVKYSVDAEQVPLDTAAFYAERRRKKSLLLASAPPPPVDDGATFIDQAHHLQYPGQGQGQEQPPLPSLPPAPAHHQGPPPYVSQDPYARGGRGRDDTYGRNDRYRPGGGHGDVMQQHQHQPQRPPYYGGRAGPPPQRGGPPMMMPRPHNNNHHPHNRNPCLLYTSPSPRDRG